MRDILLHIAGALLIMAICALPSTPWPVSWYVAAVWSGFWWIREVAQDRAKHGRFRSLTEWGTHKRWEAIAPTAVCILSAAGITAYQVTR
jgi:hypothetical protein